MAQAILAGYIALNDDISAEKIWQLSEVKFLTKLETIFCWLLFPVV